LPALAGAVAPELVDELAYGDRPAGSEQQGGQQRPPFGRADLRPLVPIPDFERAQDPEQRPAGRLNHTLIVTQDLDAMLVLPRRI